VGPESCDDGNVISGDGCSSICVTEPTTAGCGDSKRSGAEQCDLGAANGTFDYGGCTVDCQLGAYCGDGIVNGEEECDFATLNNRGVYGDPSGCTRLCQRPHYCGDSIVDAVEGEQCDDGKWNGTGSTACATNCRLCAGAMTTRARGHCVAPRMQDGRTRCCDCCSRSIAPPASRSGPSAAGWRCAR
jgi:cysteine-rich repeat protein